MKPHRIRYWLRAKPDERFAERCADICRLYAEAQERLKDGVRTVSVDEMTGIQALERVAPPLPLKPGKVERRECEYIRHGTQTLIAGFDVATGRDCDLGKLEREIATVADDRCADLDYLLPQRGERSVLDLLRQGQ